MKQALQFGDSGNADAALVALSLVVNDHDNPWTLIAETEHAPIEQALAVCKNGENASAAKAFAAFVASQGGRALMKRYGFLLPGEEAPVAH